MAEYIHIVRSTGKHVCHSNPQARVSQKEGDQLVLQSGICIHAENESVKKVMGFRSRLPVFWQVDSWPWTRWAGDGELPISSSTSAEWIMGPPASLEKLQVAPLQNHMHESEVF